MLLHPAFFTGNLLLLKQPSITWFRIASLLMLLCGVRCSEQKFDGKNGIKVVHFPGTDAVKQSIEYKDGKKHGLFKEFYRDGKPKTIQHYEKGEVNDTSFFYHANGRLAMFQISWKGLRNGCWKKFNEEGLLYSEMNFKNDLLDGPLTEYTYRSGRLLKRANYKEGTLDGQQEAFYNSGQPKSKANYYEGSPYTDAEEWTEAGKKIDNDFKMHVSERNEVLLKGTLSFVVTLDQPDPDDAVYEVSLHDTGRVVTIITALKKTGNNFLLEYPVGKRGFVMEKVKLAAYRKTELGNTVMRTTTFIASANNF